MKKSLVLKSTNQTKQIITDDTYAYNNQVIEPFLNYNTIKALYSANIYHQRSLKLKALLLSQIEDSNINNHLTNIKPHRFLYNFILNLETYGTAFIEKTGIGSNFALYLLNSFEGRLDKEYNIYQDTHAGYIKLEGSSLSYPTILSQFYGEPDYISTLNQIVTLYKADQYNSLFFENGGRPEQIIVFEDADPTDEQIEAIKQFYKKEFVGYKNSHKTLILTTGEGNGETKPKIRIEDSSTTNDLSFEKLKKVGREEIIAAHAVPPRLVGIVEGNHLGGSGELIGQLQMFNELVIKPKMSLIEEFFNDLGIELKLKPFDVNNFKNNTDLLTKLVSANILSAKEAKSILGW